MLNEVMANKDSAPVTNLDEGKGVQEELAGNGNDLQEMPSDKQVIPETESSKDPRKVKRNRRKQKNKARAKARAAEETTKKSGTETNLLPADNAPKPSVPKKNRGRDARAASRETDDSETLRKRYPSVASLDDTLRDWRQAGNKPVSKPKNDKHAKNDERRFSKAQKIADLLDKRCKESGFEPTSDNFHLFPANAFETTNLSGLYDKHLVKQIEGSCANEQDRLKSILFRHRYLKPKFGFKVGIVSGVAGSGKSTLIRKLCAETNTLCVVANPRLKETDYSGVNNVFTLHEILLSVVPIKSDVVFVDEYTLAGSAEILLLQRVLHASFIVLFGDIAQGESDSAKSPEYLRIPVVYRSMTSHRLGKKTAEFCKKHGQSFIPASKEEDEIILTSYEGETQTTDKNMALTDATIEDLRVDGIEASLVHEVQGKEYDSATLFVRDEDMKEAAVPYNRNVAFTRHRKLLIIRAQDEVRASLANGEFKTNNKRPNSHKYVEQKVSYVDSGKPKTK